MTNEPPKQWKIERPLEGQPGMPGLEICQCDSPEAVVAVVKALLSASKKTPTVLTITEFRDL